MVKAIRNAVVTTIFITLFLVAAILASAELSDFFAGSEQRAIKEWQPPHILVMMCDLRPGWRNAASETAFYKMARGRYPLKHKFINDFATQDSDLIPVAECIWRNW